METTHSFNSKQIDSNADSNTLYHNSPLPLKRAPTIAWDTKTNAVGPLPVRDASLTKQMDNRWSFNCSTITSNVLWVTIVGIHIMGGIYYGLVAYVYKKIPFTFLRISMDSFGLSIDMKYFPLISVCHAIISVMHGICLIDMLIRSLKHRRMIFHRIETVKKQAVSIVRPIDDIGKFECENDQKNSSFQKLVDLKRHTNDAWEQSFGLKGIFGVGGKYFSILFLVREAIETILQSIQAYQLSEYVPRVWLNRFSVAAVVISCWSTPMLQKLLHKYPRQELLLCVLVDVVLDFVSCVGIPTALALAYVQDYLPSETTFKLSNWADNIWYGNFVNEFKLLFIQNWYDFTSRALFAITLLFCLDDVKMLASAADFVVFRPTSCMPKEKIAIWNHRVEKIVHFGLILWGCLIMGLHLEAGLHKPLPGCIVQVYPWATAQASCSYFQVDCKAFGGIVGKAIDVEAPWAEVNAKSVSVLGFQSCMELHIPESVRNFTNMVSFDMRYVTLAEWNEEAALSKKFHPKIRRLVLVGVNFAAFGDGTGSTLPSGMVSSDFPPALQDIVVYYCSLSELPPDLDEFWPKNINLMLQGNSFDHVPEVLLRMDLSNLNLKSNRLLSLPRKLFEIDSLRRIQIGQNPYSALPSDVATVGASLSQLLIDTTNITSVPEWMTTNEFLEKVDVEADGTPLCARLKSQEALDEESAKLHSYFCPGYHT